MKKISRKILPSFILTALLVIAGGFSDGMVASASTMDSMTGRHGGAVHLASEFAMLHQGMPASDGLKPCCQDKQGNAVTTVSSAFNQNVKFTLSATEGRTSADNSAFKHKVTELSSASPPKPDILSSILKKE